MISVRGNLKCSQVKLDPQRNHLTPNSVSQSFIMPRTPLIQRTFQPTTHILKSFFTPSNIHDTKMPLFTSSNSNYEAKPTAPRTTINAAGLNTNKGEAYEPRQTSDSGDAKPDPSKSLPLSPARQRLIDDVIALYSCEPTMDRVKRYTRDCVYDDQFSYANDRLGHFLILRFRVFLTIFRYQMAGQWFALPKLFKKSENLGYEVIRNDKDLIQFKNEQAWTFPLIPKTAVVNALVSLSLDPATSESDFPQIKYHKDQADQRDYSHHGIGHVLKKFQAERASWWQNDDRVQAFKGDKGKEFKTDYPLYKNKMSDEVTGFAQA